MPYRLTDEGSFVRISFLGHVTRQDLEDAVAALSALEQTRSPVPDRIISLTETEESDLKLTDLIWAAAQRRSLRFANAYRAAIVAPQPAQFGYARMFQMLSNHPDVTLRAFREDAGAVAWLSGQ